MRDVRDDARRGGERVGAARDGAEALDPEAGRAWHDDAAATRGGASDGGPLACRSRGRGRAAAARGRAALDGARHRAHGRARPGDAATRRGSGSRVSIAAPGRSLSCAACSACLSAGPRARRSRPGSTRARAQGPGHKGQGTRARADRALLGVIRPGPTPGAGARTGRCGLMRRCASLAAAARGPAGAARPAAGGCCGWLLRARATHGRHGHPIAPDRIGRTFASAAPDQSLPRA